METAELIEIINRGEDSHHQFKADINNVDSLAAEMVAFSNAGGGKILIGVSDVNAVNGLSADSIGRLNQLISNAASQNVRPPVNPSTENVTHPDGIVLVVTITEGISKPYMDKNGIIWVKSGADKRRATSREEIQRMFQRASLVHADEITVSGMGLGDLDLPYFEKFFEANFGDKLADELSPLHLLLENMNLADKGVMNIAGALLFAKTPQFRLPAFIVKAVAFPGTDIEDEHYIESKDITGKLADVFQQSLSFVISNTSNPQSDRSFNSTGDSEIPRIVWEELLANALIHRDYFITAPVRLLIFSDRVEIISPGHLPNNLTIANILAGNSNIRNPVLASFATKILPYRGLGSGVLRASRAYSGVEFVDDREGNTFRVIVKRQTAPAG